MLRDRAAECLTRMKRTGSIRKRGGDVRPLLVSLDVIDILSLGARNLPVRPHIGPGFNRARDATETDGPRPFSSARRRAIHRCSALPSTRWTLPSMTTSNTLAGVRGGKPEPEWLRAWVR